tara:strand:- start:1518 stop:1649 length:132 start_codon:yes stop_codon:yes gene_type:complete
MENKEIKGKLCHRQHVRGFQLLHINGNRYKLIVEQYDKNKRRK